MLPTKSGQKAGGLYTCSTYHSASAACVLSNSDMKTALVHNISIIVHKYVKDGVQKALFYVTKNAQRVQIMIFPRLFKFVIR